MRPAFRRRSIVAVGVALLLLAALVAELTNPKIPPLWGATVWGVLVFASFVGYGRSLARLAFPDARVDVGLVATWGASVMGVLGGLLMAGSLCTRGAILGLVDVGGLLCAADLVLGGSRLVERARSWGRLFIAELTFAVPIAFLVGACVFFYLAAISNWHVNPFDDEIAYLPFVKRLLDTGSVLEPFSFRRLSAYGGQTFFAALFAPRTDLSQSFLFDQGICPTLVTILIVGFRSRRSPPLLLRVAAALFYLTLPNLSINTASYHSGTVFFLGLYRTLVFVDDHRDARPVEWRAPLVLALVAGVTCTLRQNYLPVPVVALGISYGAMLWTQKADRRRVLVEAGICTAIAVIVLLPWMIGGWRSNHTFLFPLAMGTANPELQLKVTGGSLWKELSLQVETALDGMPIRTLPILFVVVALVRDARVRKPLIGLALGSAFGFVVLVHSFSQSDAGNIGRYAFAFVAASALAIVLQTGRASDRNARGRRAHLAMLAAAAMMCVSFYDGRIPLLRSLVKGFHDIDAHALVRPDMEILRKRSYVGLQETIPAGAKMAVLVDEGYYFDYARNPIYNLDMPGYASPAPGQPFFQGSEKTAEYFRGLDVRYLCFVEAEYSRYHFQRDFWVGRLMSEAELWRKFSPYLVDFITDLADLAKRYRVVYQKDGLVAVDLQEPRRGE